jgi:hypothetical protein
MWKNTHPKLYELCKLSQSQVLESHENNYFHNFEEEGNDSKDRLKSLESDLSCLDKEAWEYLKNKLSISKAMINPSEKRKWEQFSDYLNEIKGYLYLKDAGCDEIQYIEEEIKKTPDFYAVKNNDKYLLEVKTINISDDEAERRQPDNLGGCRSLEPGINSGLNSQIISKIKQAEKQLETYKKNKISSNCKLYIMICIKYDNRWKGREKNDLIFENIINNNKPDSVEEIVLKKGYQL